MAARGVGCCCLALKKVKGLTTCTTLLPLTTCTLSTLFDYLSELSLLFDYLSELFLLPLAVYPPGLFQSEAFLAPPTH